MVRERIDALFVTGDSLYTSRRVQFVTLAARDRIPAAYSVRDFVVAGGLMSFRLPSCRSLDRRNGAAHTWIEGAFDGVGRALLIPAAILVA